MCEKAQEELQALAEKYQDQQKEVIDIQEKLQVNNIVNEMSWDDVLSM